MWKVSVVIGCLLLLVMLQTTAAATSDSSPAASTADLVRDYQTVRSLGLALAVLAFLTALGRFGTSDAPHERARAQDLLVKALVAFVVLAGDRLVARGVCGWFSVCQWLPPYWQ